MKRFKAGDVVWVRATYKGRSEHYGHCYLLPEYPGDDDIRADVPGVEVTRLLAITQACERAEAAEKDRDEWKASYKKLREWWERDRNELCDTKEKLELAESVTRLAGSAERERAEKAEAERDALRATVERVKSLNLTGLDGIQAESLIRRALNPPEPTALELLDHIDAIAMAERMQNEDDLAHTILLLRKLLEEQGK